MKKKERILIRDKNLFNKITFEDNKLIQILCGPHGDNLKILGEKIGLSINIRGNEFSLHGDDDKIELGVEVLKELYSIIRQGFPLYPSDVVHAVDILSSGTSNLKDIFLDTVYITFKNRIITPKSISQKEYIDSIRKNDIVFGIGPAGTGKTYLAMAMAVAFLTKKEVERIILTRPAVEAGEKLGFLPGTLYDKVNPYLRPLYDALNDMMPIEKASLLIEKGIIEIAPLAFMRGRTLNDSFVILDEAQNTTSEQMKMFLTRLGFNSKAVITGDITQIDLEVGKISGLIEVEHILKQIDGIKFCYFSEKDVVRHPLVQEIIKAYEKLGKNNKYHLKKENNSKRKEEENDKYIDSK